MIVLIIVFISLLSESKSKAYTPIGYKLLGSWYDDYYYVAGSEYFTKNGRKVNFKSITTNAIYSWNKAVNSTSSSNLDIKLTYNNKVSKYKTRASLGTLDRGATGWRGYTYYHGINSSGNSYTINYGGYPNKNYQNGSAVINIYYVHKDPYWKIQNTVMHELGHIFGLKHSKVSGSLMIKSSASYTSLKTPTKDDILGVRYVYK